MKSLRNMRWLVVLLSLAISLACAVQQAGTLPTATNTVPTQALSTVTPQPTIIPANTSFVVNTDVLEIRIGPGTSYATIGYAYRDEQLAVDIIYIDPSLRECQRWGRIVGTSNWACLERATEVTGYIPAEAWDVPLFDANTYEICGAPGRVVGSPGGVNVLYILPVGTRVRVHERSKSIPDWVMIKSANWLPRANLCVI